MMAAALTTAELEQILVREFPQSSHLDLEIEQAGDMTARLRMPINDSQLRPGGTVSGPTLFWLADVGLYVAVMAMVGPKTQSVTTSITVNFLRLPSTAGLIAEVKLLKLGRRLAVGEVSLFSDGMADPVAHVTGTYALPPEA
ncbi:MAG: PaaI family thioesterase [Minwuia sp.]|nr:PaaI family thioesterase [Minwuia sp.]